MRAATRTFETAFLGIAAIAISLTSAAHEGKLTFAPVLAKATPAVVSIQVERRGGANPWRRDRKSVV